MADCPICEGPCKNRKAQPVQTHEEQQHAATYGKSPALGALYGGPSTFDHDRDLYEQARDKFLADAARTSKPVEVKPALPEGAADRKAVPMVSGLLDYFPAALIAVAAVSKIGNDQHNAGQPIHWERGKSGDEADALFRHLVDRGLVDTDGVRHSAKVAWRALALLQKELEAAGEAAVSRGSWT